LLRAFTEPLFFLDKPPDSPRVMQGARHRQTFFLVAIIVLTIKRLYKKLLCIEAESLFPNLFNA